MNAIALTADERIQREVLDELHWNASVSPSAIGVEVVDGIVTLSGAVERYDAKWWAPEAVLRGAGVHAGANELKVKIAAAEVTTDTAIARDVVAALDRALEGPEGRVKAIVSHGLVVLEGMVDTDAQRHAAQAAVHDVPGVLEIMNLIEVEQVGPRAISSDLIKREIERTLTCSAEVHARRIQVEVEGSSVTLRGYVRSLVEREEAEQVASSIPGVGKVKNSIAVWPW